MKIIDTVVAASVLFLTAHSAMAKPADLRGLSCERENNFGMQIWDFYGDIAVKRYSDGALPAPFVRIGEGAYEDFGRVDGEWNSIYYFFNDGEGLMMRVYARPGSIVREENPLAPWQAVTVPFSVKCVRLSEATHFEAPKE